MLDNYFNDLKEFAENTSHIESVIIVGSYARGTNKATSDLDIVIITSKKAEMVANQEFTQNFGKLIRNKQNTTAHVLLFVCGMRTGKKWSLDL